MNKGKKEKKDKKEKLDEMADTAADVTDSILYGVEVASHAVEAVTTIAVPFAQFIPLIRDVTDILNKVTDLYRTAQHNKNITEVLMERIAAANSAVQILQAREDFFNSKDYTSLQRLVQVLQKMKKYIEEITQFSTVQKFLGAKSIERQYKELCNDYDSSISLLNFTLTVGFKIDSEKEDKILKEDIEELLKFQTALAESIADVGEKMTSVDEKIVGANDKVELVIEKVNEMQNTIEKVSEMQITMQNLMNNQKNEKGNQDKIDIIFNESLLPFEDYEEADEPPRSDRLRKFIHVKTKLDFAFKLVDKENYNTVKNQVTILKKLKDCQNIIQFYGLTHDGSNYHLVTEWAENRTLREFLTSNAQDIDMRLRIRIRIAYDIAKGLNFINSVGIVHRDIRSENIVITNYEVAKITNFKFSRKHNTATNNLSANKECIVYTAPELLKRITEAVEKSKADEEERRGENKKYDTKCEVYSFGILLWEIAECRVPYENIGDFLEITKKVIKGHREPFTSGNIIPEQYKSLVNRAVDQNPGRRPIFSKMLTDLKDIFNNYTQHPISRSGSLNNGRPPLPPPVRKLTVHTIAAADEDCAIDFNSINSMSLEKAIDEYKKDSTDKSTLYKCFDNYAKMGIPVAKYWKAYFILKDWSDLSCSKSERYKIAAELYKEAADYGDEFPDAQLRYATLVMHGKGVEPNTEEAVKYFLKAAKNDHVVAMFNVSTYYFSQRNDELGKYYMMMAASKKYDQAIKYCKNHNITF